MVVSLVVADMTATAVERMIVVRSGRCWHRRGGGRPCRRHRAAPATVLVVVVV